MALAGCSLTKAKPPEVVAIKPDCPVVPACVWPQLNLFTNGDLVAALIDGEAAFLQCKAAKDTLEACIKSYRD